MKGEGAEDDLLARLAADPAFASVAGQIPAMVDPRRFLGRSEAQVAEFLGGEVAEALTRNADVLAAVAREDVRV